MDKSKCTLYSGGHKGTESAFGECAEKWGINEVNYTFPGQQISRENNTVILSESELKRGDISMELVSQMMDRTYYEADKIRKVLQTIFHMVNNGHQIFAVGTIMTDNSVKGGTGWAVELAKLFNRPLHVFDQDKNRWFAWRQGTWVEETPRIEHETFVGSGTRDLTESGRQAIKQLFIDTFGAV